jgi:hypothetical protein
MAASWAEVVERGGVLPSAGMASNSSPPAAGHSPSPPPFSTLLNLYRRCKRERRWARLTLETVEGEEELNFCCIGISSSAAATVSSAPATRRRGKKRAPNERRREKETRRREQQAERRREGAAAGAAAPGAAQLTAATPSAAVSTAATLATAKSAAPSSVVAATAVAINAANRLVAAINIAAINSAGSPAAVTPTPAAAEEKTISAAIAAAARPEMTATAALRERSKLAAGERRASARTLVLARRREGANQGPLKLSNLQRQSCQVWTYAWIWWIGTVHFHHFLGGGCGGRAGYEGGARCEGMAGPRRTAKRVDVTATLSAACRRKKKRRK